MRRFDFIYTALLLPLDYVMLIIAGMFAYELRKTEFIRNLDFVSEIFYEIPTTRYLLFLGVLALVWVVFYAIAGLYNQRTNQVFLTQVTHVFLASTAGIAAVIIFLFFKREFLLSSRFIVLTGWLGATLLVLFGRALIRIIRRFLLFRGIGAKPVIVVGSDTHTKHFIEQLNTQSRWGYAIVSRVVTLDQLKKKVDEYTIDEVILTDLNYSREKVNQLLEFCQTHHLDFRYAADILGAHRHNIEMSALAGFPIISIKRTPLEGWGRVKKRLMDLILGALALMIIFIPGIIIAFLIKATSRGPVLVKLTRVGEGGVIFKLYKFRSMVVGAEKLKKSLMDHNERKGPLFKIKDDPRITRFGKILRRFSLDELPNFYNVLIGNMSLVGPRPHEPEEVKHYSEYQKKLLTIKPGITGISQTAGRSGLDFAEETRLDLYYIENWNLKLDFSILLKTPFIVLFRREDAV